MFHAIPRPMTSRKHELEDRDAVVPRLVPGGLLVADNAINHSATLQPLIDRALGDPRVDALVVPIAKGQLVCRKLSIVVDS